MPLCKLASFTLATFVSETIGDTRNHGRQEIETICASPKFGNVVSLLSALLLKNVANVNMAIISVATNCL